MKGNVVRVGKVNAAILAGEEDVSLWDDDELMRGQRRSKNGGWTGRPPKVVPKAVHDELVKRKMSEAFSLLRDNIVEAVKVLIEVAKDPEVEAGTRVKAAGMILDRTLGKPKENIELSTILREREPWEELVSACVVPLAALEVGEADDETG